MFTWHTRVSTVLTLKFIAMVLTSIPDSILNARVIIKIDFYSRLRNDPRSLEYATGTKLF